MKVILNGEEKSLTAPTTVASLLAELGLAGQRIAIEVNREIVPRGRHAEYQLHDNDRIEVVRAIGGG